MFRYNIPHSEEMPGHCKVTALSADRLVEPEPNKLQLLHPCLTALPDRLR
jgi:hypothetical protein